MGSHDPSTFSGGLTTSTMFTHAQFFLSPTDISNSRVDFSSDGSLWTRQVASPPTLSSENNFLLSYFPSAWWVVFTRKSTQLHLCVLNNPQHLGQEYVLSILPQFCWIIKGYAAAQQVISKCFLGKKFEYSCRELTKGEVDGSRTPPMWGWTFLALFFIHHGSWNVKRYGCRFTCLVVRAILIEVIHSLNIDKRHKSWKCRLKVYLPTLQKREKWMNPCRCFTPGDLALIADKSMPCGR